MITLSIEVVMADGTSDAYPVTPRVQVEFERHFKTSMIGAFSGEPHIEHLYWMGWRSMHAAGHVVKPFDQWLEQVASVSPVDEGATPLDPPPSS